MKSDRIFMVKKPCVIEAKFYKDMDVYTPSKMMSDIALNALIKNEFLVEMKEIPLDDPSADDGDYFKQYCVAIIRTVINDLKDLRLKSNRIGARSLELESETIIRKLSDAIDNIGLI